MREALTTQVRKVWGPDAIFYGARSTSIAVGDTIGAIAGTTEAVAAVLEANAHRDAYRRSSNTVVRDSKKGQLGRKKGQS